MNPYVPGLVVTGSTDRTVKLWNVAHAEPRLVISRDMDVGRVFSTKFAPDRDMAFRLAIAGSNGQMKVWDTNANTSIRKAFEAYTPRFTSSNEERIMTLSKNSRDYEDEDDDDRQ